MTRITKLYDKAFLTGADSKTEWMLPWFFENYKKHNKTPIIFANFGVTDIKPIRKYASAIMDLTGLGEKGWFKKPKSMIHAPAKKCIWLDSDCEVKGNLDEMFDLLNPAKLNMVEDKPWTTRRREEWYNSGVVGFVDKPEILVKWAKQVEKSPKVGDQEVLHEMLDPLSQMAYINPLPPKYNYMRLMIEDYGENPDAKIVHWTGAKGKDIIREQMNG